MKRKAGSMLDDRMSPNSIMYSLHVVMLGTSLDTKGGVSSVERELLCGLKHPYVVSHLATHQDGPKAVKLCQAAMAYFRLLDLQLSGRCDIVHVHFCTGASFWRKTPFIITARLFGRPVIGHAHGGEFASFYSDVSGALRRRIIRFVLRQFSILVVLSPQWYEFYGRLLPKKNIRIIPNPVTLPAATVRCSPTPRAILSLGELRTRKGTYDLLEACTSVFAIVPDAELWLAGDGELDAVRNIVAARNWQSRVRLLGWITGKEKLSAFQAAQVFALPSYAEALPVALLEAMAHQLPPVTTPVGGIPWVVENNRTGLLVRPGDTAGLASALVSLLQDEDLRNRIGTAARQEIVSRFATELVVPQVEAAYSEILAPNSASARSLGRTRHRPFLK